jgi:hypothetical protein
VKKDGPSDRISSRHPAAASHTRSTTAARDKSVMRNHVIAKWGTWTFRARRTSCPVLWRSLGAIPGAHPTATEPRTRATHVVPRKSPTQAQASPSSNSIEPITVYLRDTPLTTR